MVKSKLIVLKNARNSAGTKLHIWLEHLFLSFLHGVFIMLYIKSYKFVSLLIPSSPNVISKTRPQSQGLFWDIMIFLDSSHDSRENEVRFCKLELGFSTYGWICLLDPSGPNVASRPQTSEPRNVLRFHDFVGFISWFLRKGGPVC